MTKTVKGVVQDCATQGFICPVPVRSATLANGLKMGLVMIFVCPAALSKICSMTRLIATESILKKQVTIAFFLTLKGGEHK